MPKEERDVKNLQLQMISILQGMQEDDDLWRGLITIIAKRFNMAYSILTMGTGSMHTCHRQYYFSQNWFLLSIYRGELSFLQPVHFCICWCDSAILISYLFQQWLACMHVPIGFPYSVHTITVSHYILHSIYTFIETTMPSGDGEIIIGKLDNYILNLIPKT